MWLDHSRMSACRSAAGSQRKHSRWGLWTNALMVSAEAIMIRPVITAAIMTQQATMHNGE